MSVSKYLYLGPYFECTCKPVKRTDHVKGCTNKKCKNYPKEPEPDDPEMGKFCSACGSPYGKVPIEVEERTHPYDVVEDELFEINCSEPEDPNLLWLVPNVQRKGAPRPDFDDEGEVHLDLQQLDPSAEIRWLETAFAKELVKLKKAYAKVTVKWGLHQYFM
jgi:hypothetical protein